MKKKGGAGSHETKAAQIFFLFSSFARKTLTLHPHTEVLPSAAMQWTEGEEKSAVIDFQDYKRLL